MQAVSRCSAPRVAFVTGGLKLGGTSTFLCNLAGELIRRGLVAEVFSFENENPLADDFQKLNIPVHAQDARRSIFEDRMLGILQRLAAFQPTAVVANLGPASFEALRYVPAGVLRIGTGQSDDGIVYDTLQRYAPFQDVVAVVSRAMQTKAKARPELSPLPVECLPYGVPMPAMDATFRPAGAALKILYLGRLDRVQKRVHLFPEILESLKASGIPFHWTIAGEGPDRAMLENSLRSQPPQQTVSFTGKISYQAVPEILAAHDVFLLASDYEGLPLSLLEAMGRGLVPVVSDLPSGIRDLVDATNGILVPVNATGAYAEAIVHLHHHRAELAAKAMAARVRVRQEFSIAAMTDRWLKIFSAGEKEIAPWPKRWRIQAPLAVSNPLFYSPPARVLRRIAVRFRK